MRKSPLDLGGRGAWEQREEERALGARLSNFISALKKSTQTPLSKRSSVRAKVGGERNAYYAEYSKQI